MLKLYHNDMSVCAQKVRMILCAKQLDWQSEHLDLRAGDQHRPEFLKLNPKSVVPVLVHNDKVITESNVIVEYLEDVFPEVATMPADPHLRAQARWWLLQLDAGLHLHVATISFCLAFRLQLLERYPDENARNQFISNIPDAARRSFMEDTLANGVKSPRLKFAVLAYDKLLTDMAAALDNGSWLVGNDLSAADIGYIPYLDRLEQLGLSSWWADKPEIDAWLQRVRSHAAYIEAIEKWKNPKYLKLMASLSDSNWASIAALR